MKKLFKNYLSLIAIIIAGLITAYFVFIVRNSQGTSLSNFGQGGSNSITTPDDRSGDTAFGGLFLSAHIPDTIPHDQYRKLEDSVNQIRQRIEQDNKSIGGTGFQIGNIGLSAMPKLPENIDGYKHREIDPMFIEYVNMMDTLSRLRMATNNKDSIQNIQIQIDSLSTDYNKKRNEENKIVPKDQLYYLTLTGYSLNDYESRFFISKGTYNLTYAKWDRVEKIGSDSNRYGHYQSKQIPVRYAADEKKIMIPISHKQFNIISSGLKIISVVFGFFLIYILLGLPIQILINISRGKAFIKKNITMFRQMSILLFIYALFSIALPYLLRLLFWKKIPADFSLPRIWESVFNNLYTILIAIGLFVISKAFEKGYKLQEEQELTV